MKTVFDITADNSFEPELRRLYLGATDVTALLCLNNYKTPYELWLEKTGQSVEKPLTEEQEDLFYWGHALEPLIIQRWLEKNPDWELVSRNEFVIDIEYNFLAKNIDAEVRHKVTGELAVLEAKTVASTAFKKWKLCVPLNYYTQGQDYLGVKGYRRCFFALLVMDSRDFVQYEVERDDAYIEEIRDLSVKFWEDNVQKNVAPDKLAFDWATTEVVDEDVVASDSIRADVANLKLTKAAIKKLEGEEEELATRIKEAIQDKSVLVDREGNRLVTWNGSNVTRAVSTKIILEKAPDLYASLTNTKYERKMLLK